MTTDLTKPVRTRSGLDVRILCTDAPGVFPIKGFYIGNDGESYVCSWSIEGRICHGHKLSLDLVNAPETTKRYVPVWPSNCFRDKVGAGEFVDEGTPILELTYEGDRLSAVRIVEDE